MPEFKFDRDRHIYTLDGERLPSTTQVLPYDNYDGLDPYFRERGSAVHRMIYLFNNGREDEIYTDPLILPFLDDEKLLNYLESYKYHAMPQFINSVWDYKTGSKHPATELQLAAYQFLVKEGLTEQNENLRDLALKNEIVRHEVPLYHPIYRFAGTVDYVYLDDGQGSIKSFVLYLDREGKPAKAEEIPDLRKNLQIFLCHLTAFKWQIEKGLRVWK